MVTSERTHTFNELGVVRELGNEQFDLLAHPLLHLQSRERVLASAAEWIWDEDPVHHHSGAEISVASAFYGKPLNSAQEIFAEAQRLMANLGHEDIPDYTSQAGFPVLRQMPAGLEKAEYQLTQEMVAAELISNALAAQGISPKEVDLFIAVTSIPIDPHFDHDWATAVGIPADVPMVRICEACNSSGHAIARVLEGDFDQKIAAHNPNFAHGTPANIVLFALDDANRMADKGGDPLSPQFFSTGAAAMVWKYHPESPSSLKMVLHKSMSEERGTEFLKVPRPYDDWDEADKEDLYTAQFLKKPDHEGPIEMDPRASGAFITYAMRLADEVMDEYIAQGGSVSDIKRVIIHHPSKTVFDGAVKRMTRQKRGFTEDQIHWEINEGNVPVATIPIAFGRQLEALENGDRLLFLSFGAGGEYTCFIADFGVKDSTL